MAWVEIMLPSARTLPTGKLTQNPIRTGEWRCILYVGDDSGITLAWDHATHPWTICPLVSLKTCEKGRNVPSASRVPDVQRFAAHLTREFTAIWSFLFDPTIDATNWRAEHAIRPAVVTRKVWGGNRTW